MFEVTLPEEGPYLGVPINQVRQQVPGQFVFGAIRRENRLMIPRGHTVLREGDHVVLVSDADVSDDILDALT